MLRQGVFLIVAFFLVIWPALGQNAFCDEKISSECVINQEHDLNPDSYGFSSVFQSRDSAVVKSLSGESNLSVFNLTYLSGLWKGSFNISTNGTVIRSGAEFRPKGGNIVIGSPLPAEMPAVYPSSCEEVSGNSGIYEIDPDGVGGSSPFKVYCDMSTDGGGWTLVANVEDMSIAPSEATEVSPSFTDYVTTSGGYPTVDSGGSGGGISYLRFDTYNISYDEVRGEVTIDSVSSLDAISDCCTSGSHLTLDDYYVDGVSLTTYSNGKRSHLHTFINDGNHDSGQEYSCPDQGGDPVSVVSFDLNSWECRDGGSDVNYNQFSKDLSSNVTSEIEVRLMKDEPDSNENVVLKDAAIWIR